MENKNNRKKERMMRKSSVEIKPTGIIMISEDQEKHFAMKKFREHRRDSFKVHILSQYVSWGYTYFGLFFNS